MTNLYRDTAEPAPPTPALAGDLSVDVAVVGAGFTGLSTALHLVEKGARVAVLEAQEPGWGASGRNGGQVNPGLKHDPEVVGRDFGPELGARMVALAGTGPDFVFELIRRHGIVCEARQNGTLRAAISATQVASLRESFEQLTRRGAPVELLDGAAVVRATGTERYPAALWDRRGGDVNPLSFARGLARAAIGAGARVCGHSRVTGLARSTAGWRLGTPKGTVTAAQVVIATNGYTDGLWPGLRRSVVPVFGAIAATAPLPEQIARTLMPTRAVLYEIGTITVYYRVDGANRLLIGGRGPMREIESADAIAHLLRYAHTLWPGLGPVQWPYAWGGRLAMTADQYPHLHELAPGVIACLGYSGRGVALSTLLGAQIATRLIDPAVRFDMPFTPLKTIRFHSLWPLAVRAVIAQGRLRDALGL